MAIPLPLQIRIAPRGKGWRPGANLERLGRQGGGNRKTDRECDDGEPGALDHEVAPKHARSGAGDEALEFVEPVEH